MKTKIVHIALKTISTSLMIFWIYASADKLWDLKVFHSALLKQPFPDQWADILYWSLPIGELIIGLLLIRRFRRIAYLSSAALFLIFSIYIGLGVAGLYHQRPCGCASVFNDLSWGWHLIVNIFLMLLSILGWYLTGSTNSIDDNSHRARVYINHVENCILLLFIPIWSRYYRLRKMFPLKFTLFPGWPV